MFKEVPSVPNFVELEKARLKRWYESGVVKDYLSKNKNSKKRFSFLDGPITANNPMGVQHGQGRTLKDLFQRYKNMQGYKQRFQNGFDCQGLWLEVQEEKDLGLNSKRDIEAFGIEKFCERCKARVEKFSQIQTEQSKRLGMFMDWDNSYYTMSETNNLYIWYFLKVCHEKGWIYKGEDSMPWCVRCGTAISQHELSDDGYKTVEHTSVYVKFPLKSEVNTSLLIWTTTPWTLAANVAVAVNPKLDYLKVKMSQTEEILIVAKNRIGVLLEEYTVLKEFKGKDLLGVGYQGPFDELDAVKNVHHSIVGWSDVVDTEGTGLVHIAPGAGQEDFELGKKNELPVLAPLDEFGFYISGYGSLTGKSALDVKGDIFTSLKEKNIFYKTEKIVHSYPHCWRCKQELVFRTTSEWFISAKEVRPLLKKAVKNANWMPKSGLKRMLDWLTNMGDWPISRRRYWGLALPFYECSCGHITVVGSKKELRDLAIEKEKVDSLKELHRPWVDEIKIKCQKCGKEVSRIKEVGDCWLDAGIVPFSTVKYLEDKEYWKEWFPFEFITEYLGQVKLWFYATLFMSVTLEGKVPWKNVLATGYIMDEKGEPMHKTKGNYIPFDEAADKMGVDIMRWVYVNGNLSENTKFGYSSGDTARKGFFLILWNCYKFFITYANLDGFVPPVIPVQVGVPVETGVLCHSGKGAKRLRPESVLTSDSGVAPLPRMTNDCSVLDKWVLSELNTLVLEVTKSLDKYDPTYATKLIENFVTTKLSTWYIRRSRDMVGPSFYQTMYETLITLSKLLSPFTPYIADEIYTNLSSKKSVHLEDWPVADKTLIDKSLSKEMETARNIVEKIHSYRKQNNLRLRMPIKQIEYTLPKKFSKDIESIIMDEVNVKIFSYQAGETLDMRIVDLGDKDEKILAEGYARDMVREIQDLRKEKGCSFGDIVSVTYPKNEKTELATKFFEELIKKSALAKELTPGSSYEIVVQD